MKYHVITWLPALAWLVLGNVVIYYGYPHEPEFLLIRFLSGLLVGGPVGVWIGTRHFLR